MDRLSDFRTHFGSGRSDCCVTISPPRSRKNSPNWNKSIRFRPDRGWERSAELCEVLAEGPGGN